MSKSNTLSKAEIVGFIEGIEKASHPVIGICSDCIQQGIAEFSEEERQEWALRLEAQATLSAKVTYMMEPEQTNLLGYFPPHVLLMNLLTAVDADKLTHPCLLALWQELAVINFPIPCLPRYLLETLYAAASRQKEINQMDGEHDEEMEEDEDHADAA